MNLTTNNIITMGIIIVILFLIANKEPFLATKKVIKNINIDPIIKTLNAAPIYQNNGVNLQPLFYTAGNIKPTVIKLQNIVQNNTKITPSSNEIKNNYATIEKKEISITNDIVKPVSNFIMDNMKNPPKLNDNISLPPKHKISISNDIIKPIITTIKKPFNEDLVITKINQKNII